LYATTTGTPAFTLVVNLDQISGDSLYGRWWGQLNGDSFYYPCKIPLPLAKINPNITLIDERDDAKPLWDWAELAPRRRTVSKLMVVDDKLSAPREGNPWNLRQPNERLYYDGHTDSRVIKATKVNMVDTRIGITSPKVPDMYRGCATDRGLQAYGAIHAGGNQALHYWRVPVCYHTVALMASTPANATSYRKQAIRKAINHRGWSSDTLGATEARIQLSTVRGIHPSGHKASIPIKGPRFASFFFFLSFSTLYPS
jgi:hypothetical protein